MGNLGATEILLIFFAILILFGAKRIPEIARGLGKGIREFKAATREISSELNIDDQPRIQSPRPPVQQPMPRADYAPSSNPSEAPPQ